MSNKSLDYIINLLFRDNNATGKAKEIETAIDNVNKTVQDLSDQTSKKINSAVDSANQKIKDGVSKTTDNVKKQVDQTSKSVSDNVEKAATGINKKFNGIDFKPFIDNIKKSIGEVNKKLNAIQVVAIIDSVRNVSEAFGNLTGPGVGFQQSMADLSSITGIAGKDLEDLGRVARETGKESGLGAKGAADAFALLASQIQVDSIGMDGLKILQKETIKLAHAAGMDMSDAATAMAATINQFGLKATEANRVINVLAAGSKYGAAEIVDLAQSFKVSGAVAASAGLSVEQAAGAIEILSKSNLKGAEAGTALRNILLKMQTELKVDFNKTGLGTALDALKPRLNDVTYLSKVFGMENIAAAQFLITNAKSVDEMTKAVTGTSVAEEQAAIRTNTAEESMKRMQAKIDDVKIGIFNLTGGLTAYVSACGDSVVMVAQMIPLFKVLQTGFATLTTKINLSNIAGKVFAGVQAAINAVMSANPIAMVVLAISAMVTGIIIAYNNCESFRRIVDKAWATIKDFAAIIWNNLCKAFDWLATVIGKAWDKLKQLFGIKDKDAAATKKQAETTGQMAEQQSQATQTTNALAQALDKQNAKANTNINTIGGLENKIKTLREQQSKASMDNAAKLEKEINLLDKKLQKYKDMIIIGASDKAGDTAISSGKNPGVKVVNPSVDKDTNKLKMPDSGPIDKISASIVEASKHVLSFNETIWGSNSIIERFATNATSGIMNLVGTMREFGTMMSNNTLNTVQKVTGGLQGMGAMMSSLSGMVSGSASGWLSWGANLLAVVAAAIPQLLALFGVQSALAVASQGKLMFPYNIIAMAATVAGIAAAVASIPKPKAFANGGIVYGNTLAQVGEYAGAQNNPEVIAPLDKLRNLIRPSQDFSQMEFRIRGTDLVAISNKVNNIYTRTR